MTLHGVIPPTTTPFTPGGDLDLKLVKGQVDWLIAQGVHGLATGGSTGEGHAIDAEEHRDLLAATVEAAAGQVPVVAGIIADSTREAIKRGKMVRHRDVLALQVTPVHYLFRPDDESMIAHFRAVSEETGQPILIYNVVPWCYLSPALLLRIFREVPGVIGVKQSAGDLKLLADLIIAAESKTLIFSAVDALLYPSFTLGAHGTIAAIPTAAPRACVNLWNAVQAGDHKTAHDLHKRLLRLWNALVSDNLPACVRCAQELQGVTPGRPRSPMPPASREQQQGIEMALRDLVTTV
jgi:4-hydroxy-tetrahydrodipicolinate synthase